MKEYRAAWGVLRRVTNYNGDVFRNCYLLCIYSCLLFRILWQLFCLIAPNRHYHFKVTLSTAVRAVFVAFYCCQCVRVTIFIWLIRSNFVISPFASNSVYYVPLRIYIDVIASYVNECLRQSVAFPSFPCMVLSVHISECMSIVRLSVCFMV